MIRLLNAILDFVIGLVDELLGELVGGVDGWLNTPVDHDRHDALTPASELVNRSETGLALGVDGCLNWKNSLEGGLLVSGKTGSGKSLLLYSMGIRTDASMVIFAPNDTVFPGLAPYLKYVRKYENVLWLDFANVDGRSEAFNPLARITTSTEARNVAQLLLAPLNTKGADPYWQREGINILHVLILILLEQDSKYRNLQNLARLIHAASGNRKGLDRLVARGSQHVFDLYKSLVVGNTSPNNLASLLSTVRSCLSSYEDIDAGRSFATDSLGDLADLLKNQRTALFVSVPIFEVARLSGIVSLFVSQLYRDLCKEQWQKGQHRVVVALDEYSSLAGPLLADSAQFASVSRKHGACQVIFLQNHAQIKAINPGLASSLLGNMNAFTFAGMPMEEAQAISQALGQFTYADEKGIKRQRPVMTPTELVGMPPFTGILSVEGKHAMVRTAPYFEKWRYRKVGKLPPLEVPQKLSTDPLPLLPIPTA